MDSLLDHIRQACMRHDTTVALAFRRALGIPSGGRPERHPRHHATRWVYDGMPECFANKKRVRL